MKVSDGFANRVTELRETSCQIRYAVKSDMFQKNSMYQPIVVHNAPQYRNQSGDTPLDFHEMSLPATLEGGDSPYRRGRYIETR